MKKKIEKKPLSDLVSIFFLLCLVKQLLANVKNVFTAIIIITHDYYCREIYLCGLWLLKMKAAKCRH